MKRAWVLFWGVLFFVTTGELSAQKTIRTIMEEESRPKTNFPMYYEIENGEKIYLHQFRTLYVYPPMVFKSKRQERFYWRTVRDVKKALPYARLASYEITKLNRELYHLPNDAARKRHISQFQKRMFREHEKDLKNMTINQGKMMVKLVEREHEINVYTIIQSYKGTMPAVFWNTIARFFGSDLKMDYDATDKDRIVERVVTLVDAGQL